MWANGQWLLSDVLGERGHLGRLTGYGVPQKLLTYIGHDPDLTYE